jgi:bacteriocin biosynthesis cyclodehydratase domain-containing protein
MAQKKAVSDTARPRLALPFSVLSSDGVVSLSAGEDFRYTFKAPGLQAWLPGLLKKMNGSATCAELLELLDRSQRDDARELIARLYSERIVVDGTAIDAHVAQAYRMEPEGSGPLQEALRNAAGPSAGAAVRVLCQDRLDYDQLQRFNRRGLNESAPFLWASFGPAARAYISPLILPNAGPCLECLLSNFKRLSPAAEFYDRLIAHARSGQPIEPVSFPPTGIEILKQLVLWKISVAGQEQPPAALYRLHVLEIDTMETGTHRVFADPECAACSGR